ncbi:MAG TPA: hypothetical protein VMZ50_07795 [Phycisphaerae bacterium]|nr:hypothetical protein [Phycisphaerae bacterium]
MSYELQADWIVLPEVKGVEDTLTTAAGDIATYRLPFDAYVWGIVARVTTDVAGTSTLPIVAVDVADNDAAANRVEVARIAFTLDDDNGDMRVGWCSGGPTLVDVSAGRVIVLERVQAAVGTAAGVAALYILCKLAGRAAELYKDV